MTERITRRRLLHSGAAAGVVGLAGCLGDGSAGDASDEGGDSDETPTPTPGSDATPGGETGDEEGDETIDEPDDQPSDGTTDDSDREPETDRPLTGEFVPSLSAFDEAMVAFMEEHDVEAGVLGVANGGEVLLERGYGWADPDLTEPLPPDAIFRIGSISKPITDAAVVKLAEEGRLAGDDAVVPLLNVEPPGGEPEDERFQDVTVEHLLTHRGGWDSGVAGDPMFEQVEVAQALDLSGPPDKYDITRYMLDQPMQFDPGARQAYSNFGYSLLGQVIEGVTGSDYQEYVESEVLGSAGVDGIEIGRTRPENRPPTEVWYDAPSDCPSVFELDESEEHSCADAWFDLRAFDSAGGHVAPTTSLLEFLDAYLLTGEPREQRQGRTLRFRGSLPGSWAVARQHPDGVDYVAMVNERQLPLSVNHQIEESLDDAVVAVEEWP